MLGGAIRAAGEAFEDVRGHVLEALRVSSGYR